MARKNIHILIIDDSNAEKCDSRCGVDWSLAQNLALARERSNERFGNQINVQYLDLSQPATNNRAQEWRRRVSQENLPLPLLVINGGVRISGQFDLRMLLDAIDAQREIKSPGW